MAQYTIRRIPLRPRSNFEGIWDDGRLDPFLNRATRIIASAILFVSRLGGLSAMLGGALWIALALQLEIQRRWFDYDAFRLQNQTVVEVLSISISFHLQLILLALICLGCVYVQHSRRASWLGVIGFLLSTVSLSWAIYLSSNVEWLSSRLLHTHLYGWPPFGWYTVVWPYLLLMSMGLGLLGKAIINSGVLPTSIVRLLIGGTLAIHLAPILGKFEQYEIATALLLLFGISWIMLGSALLRPRKLQAASQRQSIVASVRNAR
jgi:hypothetical protein